MHALPNPMIALLPQASPPHVMIIERLSTLEKHVYQLLPEPRAVPSQTVQSVIVELERRAMQANTVTYDGLRYTITGVLEQLGLTTLTDLLRQQVQGLQVMPPTSAQPTFHTWCGSLRRVTEDFEFPKSVTVLEMMQLWFFGSDTLPPFKVLTHHDLPRSISNLNRLSDLRLLMSHVTEVAAASSISLVEPSQADVVHAFEQVIIPSINGSRRSQKHWRTFVTQIRKEKRTRRE